MVVDVASTSRTIIIPQRIRNILHNANVQGRDTFPPRKIYLLVKQIGKKDLNFEKIMSANHLSFGKVLFFLMKASTIILNRIVAKLCDESKMLVFKLKLETSYKTWWWWSYSDLGMRVFERSWQNGLY